MKLKVVIEDQVYEIRIPETVLEEGEEFFQRMDSDMSRGWQMGREWVDAPDTVQRCQIAADRLADAVSLEKETLASLLAGYIVSRMPDAKEVYIATDGEPMETEFR